MASFSGFGLGQVLSGTLILSQPQLSLVVVRVQGTGRSASRVRGDGVHRSIVSRAHRANAARSSSLYAKDRADARRATHWFVFPPGCGCGCGVVAGCSGCLPPLPPPDVTKETTLTKVVQLYNCTTTKCCLLVSSTVMYLT